MIRHEGDPDRCAVVLPGIRYFSQAPLLWFAREAAQAHGWSVVEVDERAPSGGEPFGWMLGQAERALDEASDAGTVVVIGKSLGTIAATIHRGPAVWLTPLLDRTDIAQALRATTAPTLLIGSPDDPTWSGGSVPENPALDVLELPGLDHALQVSGSPDSSLDALRTVSQRVSSWLAAFAGTP
ncbi:MAG TPA: hypothetical protein VJT68_08500 [Thermoleophilaceae bacterium]|nr:hypothetical protein [Thermoleophilaceae bacterium]